LFIRFTLSLKFVLINSHMKQLVFFFVIAFMILSCKKDIVMPEDYSNEVSDSRMLLVLSAPSVDDKYYESAFADIVEFQINYALSIIGNDNVIIIVDKKTRKHYEGRVPGDILLTANIYDIWMRDFTTVNPIAPVQFKYSYASMTETDSKEVQASFDRFADRYEVERSITDFVIDGGNIVDNYAGRAITTQRFLLDNNLEVYTAKEELKKLLGASEVAIIPSDEPILAHADGMVMWVENNVLLVNDYSSDPGFRSKVVDELNWSFPGVNIIEVPVKYDTNEVTEWIGFESACGVHLNSTVTFNNVYVPTFGMSHDSAAVDMIRNSTDKLVIEVDASGVCAMGGSVRCLTWQVAGDNAERLIEATRFRQGK